MAGWAASGGPDISIRGCQGCPGLRAAGSEHAGLAAHWAHGRGEMATRDGSGQLRPARVRGSWGLRCSPNTLGSPGVPTPPGGALCPHRTLSRQLGQTPTGSPHPGSLPLHPHSAPDPAAPRGSCGGWHAELGPGPWAGVRQVAAPGEECPEAGVTCAWRFGAWIPHAACRPEPS